MRGEPQQDESPEEAAGKREELGVNHQFYEAIARQQLSAEQREVLSRLSHTLRRFFPGLSQEGIQEMVQEAFKRADMEYGLAAAAEWAQGFQIPRHLIERDVARLHDAGGCIKEVARRLFMERRGSRLNLDRVRKTISPHNPEFERLCELAQRGVEVLLPENFRPSGVQGRPRPLRNKLIACGGAVNKMVTEGYLETDLAIALPLEEVEEAVEHETCNIFTSSWAKKAFKPKGRNTCNPGNCGTGSSMHTDAVTQEAIRKWGKVVNCTLTEIVQMINNFFREAQRLDHTVSWSDVRMWKMDLRGAFTLLDFDPYLAHLMGTELEGDIIIFYLCGIFGWSSMPMAFQVVNRGCRWELAQAGRLKGRMNMYTDDAFGVCLARDLEHDMSTVRSLFIALLGDLAVEEDKTESGRRLDLIGWDFNLDKRHVGIAQKNALKAFYGYARHDLDAKIPIKRVEAWASWAERYGEICLHMRPFRRILYNQMQGHRHHPRANRHISVTIDNKARRTVRLYAALLTLSRIHGKVFTRTFESFDDRNPTLRIQFDGSLDGAGLLWFGTGRGDLFVIETLLGGAAVDLRSLNFGWDSSFQNCSEYITIIIGVVGAILMGWDTSAIEIMGDSETALRWADSGRFKSDNVINAATVMSVICASKDVHFMDSKHIPKEENWHADMFSRTEEGETWEQLVRRMRRRDPDIPRNLLQVNIPNLSELLDLCDPRREFEDDESFGAYWRRVHAFVDGLGPLHR